MLKIVSLRHITSRHVTSRHVTHNLDTDQETWSVRFPHDEKIISVWGSKERFLFCVQEGIFCLPDEEFQLTLPR